MGPFEDAKKLWQVARSILLLIGFILTVFVVTQILLLFFWLNHVHPLAGLTGLAGMAAAGLMLSFRIRRALNNVPRVPRAPLPAGGDSLTMRETRAYLQFLIDYTKRLSENPHLKDEGQRQAANALEKLDRIGKQKRASSRVLLEQIEDIKDHEICPLIEILKNRAEKAVGYAARDVGAGMALSPFRSLDPVYVLYKNFQMINEVAQIAHSRSNMACSFRLMMHAFKVLSGIHFWKIGSKFVQNLTARTEALGPFYDEITKSFATTLVTRVSGRAVMDACFSLSPHSTGQALALIRQRMNEIFDFVKDVLVVEVLPLLRQRKQTVWTEGESEKREAFWKKLHQDVAEAVRQTEDFACGWTRADERESFDFKRFLADSRFSAPEEAKDTGHRAVQEPHEKHPVGGLLRSSRNGFRNVYESLVHAPEALHQSFKGPRKMWKKTARTAMEVQARVQKQAGLTLKRIKKTFSGQGNGHANGNGHGANAKSSGRHAVEKPAVFPKASEVFKNPVPEAFETASAQIKKICGHLGKKAAGRQEPENTQMLIHKLMGWHVDGISKKYWSRGVLKEECPYRDNKIHGVVRRYYHDGRIESEQTYVCGKPEGPYKKFHADGKLQEEGCYNGDLLDGACRIYDAQGSLTHEIHFENGRETGVIEYENGAVKKAFGSARLSPEKTPRAA